MLLYEFINWLEHFFIPLERFQQNYFIYVTFRLYLEQHIPLISIHGIFFVDFNSYYSLQTKCKYAQFQACRIIAIHRRNTPW